MTETLPRPGRRAARDTSDQLALFFGPAPLAADGARTATPAGIRPTLAAPDVAADVAGRVAILLEAAAEAVARRDVPRSPGAVAHFGERALGTGYATLGFSIDEVYDALEAAAYRHARDTLGPVPDTEVPGWLEALGALESEIFHGRALTEEARALGQFSTPLEIGGAAAALLGARAGWTVSEPCAGTGGLLWALPPGLAIETAETCPRRRCVLAGAGVPVGGDDALRVPLGGASYDAVITNPPFGAQRTRRYRGFGATEFTAGDLAQRFVAAALASLRDGGRLVAVLPANTLAAAGADFRRWLAERHRPLGFLPNPDSSYRSRGAVGDTLLMVALRGPGDLPAAPLFLAPADGSGWREAVAELARASAETDGVGSGATTAGSATAEPANALRPAVTLVPARAGELALPPPPPPRARPDAARHARERAEAERSPVFAPYPHGLAESRAPHPRLVVETRSMAGIEAPRITETFRSPLCDAAWGRDGAHGGVSDEQADGALRALSAWSAGHGFLCADDVGVGKSREIALLILEAIARGHTRILVTTKNENNVADLRAELARVATGDASGGFPATLLDVGGFHDVKAGRAALPTPDGAVVYLAHAYNFEPFAEAIGDARPTVWCADEAHEFANVAGSKRGLSWARLHQRMLAHTRCFAYFTATPAVTVDNLAYLFGLGEWPIGGFHAWLDRKTGHQARETDNGAAEAAVGAHVAESAALGDSAGVEADQAAEAGKRKFMRAPRDAFSIRVTPAETEQIMRELKGSGHYIARDLWRGGVDFRVEELDLLGDGGEARAARERYDEAAALCRDLSIASRQFGRMNRQVKVAGLDRAMIQGYLKQLLFEIRLPRVLALADEALAAGRQVIISIHSVAGDGEREEGIAGADELPSANARLESAIARINVREVRKEGDGDAVEYVDLGEIPEALMVRAALLERVRRLPPLRDPIRRIEEHFGAHRVASITGRVPARQRARRMGEFQSGQREVAVISRAGKVGISLHDVNGRPRHMLVADYEWSADTFKQELGRADRTGQLSSPWIVLVATNLAGERRFAATIAARMASLGATSKGSAESTGTDALDVFDMSGGVALEAMKNAVEAMDDATRAYFTGAHFVEYQRTAEGGETRVPKRRPDGAEMRHFLLEMLLFPVAAADRAMRGWEEARDQLLTGATLELLAARRTGRQSGEVLRETPLSQSPPLTLYDIRNDAGERRALVQGFVTEFIYDIQTARGPDPRTGAMRSRRYLQFTPSNRATLISGLELTPSEGWRVLRLFGRGERKEVTPASALEDLRAGDKVPIHGADGGEWMLHLRRDGRVEVRGALISRHRDALNVPGLRGVVRFEPVGTYLYVASDEAALGVLFGYFGPVRAGGAA